MTNCDACTKQKICNDKDYTKYVPCNNFEWDEEIEPSCFCEEDEPE